MPALTRTLVTSLGFVVSSCGEPATPLSVYDGTTLDSAASDVEYTTTVVDSAPTDVGLFVEETAVEVEPEVVAPTGCATCATGCCEDGCCAVDPSQELLTELGGGTVDAATTADLTFSTGGDCNPTSLLGACSHERINADIVMCVCRVRSLVVAHHMKVVGPDGLIVLAQDTIEVSGTIDLSASGTSDGPGGGWSYPDVPAARWGGAGGSFGTYGGGSTIASGDALLEPISSGMRGQGSLAQPDIGGGRGGSLQLSAGKSITVTGTILANGGGGKGGIEGGGGGGSGGAILIEAPLAILTGTFHATGGGGGGGGGPSGPGMAGEDGRADRPARGGAGNDGADCGGLGPVEGGDGGDGAIAFEVGERSTPMTIADCTPEAWVGGGGGGGAIGRIVLRYQHPCDCSGTFVPVLSSHVIRTR